MNRRGFLLSSIAALVAPALPLPRAKLFIGPTMAQPVALGIDVGAGESVTTITWAKIVAAKKIAQRNAIKQRLIDGNHYFLIEPTPAQKLDLKLIDMGVPYPAACDNPTIDLKVQPS